MTFTKSMINRVASFMKDRGFHSKNKFFYKINNDIAFCIEFDYPGSLLYVTFYILPLYLPANTRYYTYGNRLNSLSLKPLPDIHADVSEKQKIYWVQSFEEAIDEFVLPYFQKICNPSALADACSDNNGIQTYMNCPTIQKARLLLHTYAFLQNLDAFRKAEKSMHAEIDKCSFLSSDILAKYQAEIVMLKQVFSLSQDELLTYKKNIIEATIKSCFG